jgi:SAM-dependent methyltransferase
MEPTEANLRAWDEVRGAAPPPAIPDAVRALLPELTGRHALHVPCGTGEATAELAELGALVTAVDVDVVLLEAARRRAPTAAFVQADPARLPAELQRARFDLVYAGRGILDGGSDAGAFAAQASTALRAGGRLVVHDLHPVVASVDLPSQRWRGDYYDGRHATLGAIVTAVAGAGLRIVALEELPSAARRVPGELALLALKS